MPRKRGHKARMRRLTERSWGWRCCTGLPEGRHGISVREAADRRQAITSRPDPDRRTERVPPEGRDPKTHPSPSGANCSADLQAHKENAEHNVQKQTQVILAFTSGQGA